MAVPIPMPRQGQSVESCVILEWHKKKGEKVAEGDLLFTYETDKASFEHESPAAGTLLEIFFDTDIDVPVLTTVAVIGEPGESVDTFRPDGAASGAADTAESQSAPREGSVSVSAPVVEVRSTAVAGDGTMRVSPRARKLASAKGVDVGTVEGTGPKGRVIERDVRERAAAAPMSRTAQGKAAEEGLSAPAAGTGIGGRILARDLVAAPAPASSSPSASAPVGLQDGYTEVKLSQIRKIIGERMMQSLQQSAQLTLNASANASAIMAYRAQVKKMGESLGLANITITDLVTFALTRVLPKFPEINALFQSGVCRQYDHVHLALAVDTPRGLMVPVVRFADLLSLNDLAKALKQVAQECIEGSINPDLLSGGTITLSNLGGFGIESFTPVLNPPQVALLGVNAITHKPMPAADGSIALVPYIGLSLTIDHRAVDGGPGARFLKALVAAIENINLTLSL